MHVHPEWKLLVALVLPMAGCTGPAPVESAVAEARPACVDDGNACTLERRVKGKCMHQPVADGTACGTGGTCQAGACAGSVAVPEVGVGECQVCARYPDGTALCWGYSCEGSLGRGEGTNYTGPYTPAPVLGVADAADIAVGDEHACVARTGGTVSCWGWNEGSLGDGTTDSSDVPVDAIGLTGVVDLAAGRTHSCAIVQGGRLSCWGTSFFGENGFADYTTTPGFVAGITDAVDVAAGETTTCVVHASGTVSCWGEYGERWATGAGGWTSTPTPMPGISDAVGVTVGNDHACVIHRGGTVSCFGNNSDGQLGTGEYGCGDGTWDCVSPGKPVVGLTGVTQIAASYVHTCAVQSSGQVWCFGWLPVDDGQGGVGREDVLAPQQVPGLGDAVQVSTSEVMDDADCAVRRCGQIVCWGWNASGQFGDPDAPDSLTPVPVAGLPPSGC